MTKTTATPAASPADVAIARIAKAFLRLDTLETRKSDSLDFSDQAVWNIRQALQAAYDAGRADAKAGR